MEGVKEAFDKKNYEKSDLQNNQNKGKSEKSDGYVKIKRMAGNREVEEVDARNMPQGRESLMMMMKSTLNIIKHLSYNNTILRFDCINCHLKFNA